jgi:hypothetical protein
MVQSKLDVINSMLATIGMAALTANDTQHPSYIKALAVFDNINVEWQGKGWWFNTTAPTLNPTTGDEIVFAIDVLSIDPLMTDKNYAQRGLKLYDLDNETFTITEAVRCNVVRLKDFSDLPPVAAAYLRAHARFEFYLDEDGTTPKLDRYERMVGTAWNALQTEHLKNADVNMFKGGHGLWFRTSYHNANINRTVARQPT